MSEPKFTPGPWFITKEDWVTGGYDIDGYNAGSCVTGWDEEMENE